MVAPISRGMLVVEKCPVLYGFAVRGRRQAVLHLTSVLSECSSNIVTKRVALPVLLLPFIVPCSQLNSGGPWTGLFRLGGASAFLWIMYGCNRCRLYPVCSNSWYRVTRNAKDDHLGDTNAGATVGFWHCASCFHRWGWKGGGELRLAVFGNADSQSGFQSGYDMAYVGSLTDVHEKKIAFLRSGTALTVLDGKPESGIFDERH